MKNFGICCRVFKEKDRPLIERLFAHLKKRAAMVSVYAPFYEQIKEVIDISFPVCQYKMGEELDVDLIFTIGGDGTLLMGLGMTQEGKIPILGINAGRLGFLTSVNRDNLDTVFEALDAQNYYQEQRSLLLFECEDNCFGNWNYALNECTVLKSETTSMITVHAYGNDEFINSYWCDGLIISTPTGSTGYSLSCGGPIIMPNTNSWVITPIAPHNLSIRPLVIRDDREIKLVVEGRSEHFLCMLDSRSQRISFGTEIKLRRAPFDLKIIRLEEYSFIDTTREKLMWGADKRNASKGKG